jgi:hypothetical protein
MYKGGAGSGTSRGVVVVDKKGVCRVWFMGGVSGILSFGLVWFDSGEGMFWFRDFSCWVCSQGCAAAMEYSLLLSSFLRISSFRVWWT